MSPQPHRHPHPQAPAKQRQMHVCVACESPYVQPVDWRETTGSSWEVELRCPECETRVHDVFIQREIDEYDRILDDGCEALLNDLRRLVRENMEREAQEFESALEADLILPEDF